MSRLDHINSTSRRLVLCHYCAGSGQEIFISEYERESILVDCRKCKGEGLIYQTISIVTRPITLEDKVFFRKITHG